MPQAVGFAPASLRVCAHVTFGMYVSGPQDDVGSDHGREELVAGVRKTASRQYRPIRLDAVNGCEVVEQVVVASYQPAVTTHDDDRARLVGAIK